MGITDREYWGGCVGLLEECLPSLADQDLRDRVGEALQDWRDRDPDPADDRPPHWAPSHT